MVFSSVVFLFFFLPIVFLLTRITKRIFINNIILLIFSLFFYSWGEPKYIFLMLIIIFINYLFGLAIHIWPDTSKILITICVISNLIILGYFKYFNFLIDSINQVFNLSYNFKNIILPIGISFYTFQALSYVIDLYRREIEVQKNPFYLALYISFFPQLIAGPIIKYRDIEKQIKDREVTNELTVCGIRRFIVGLSKKVIFANTFAVVVDQNFNREILSVGTLGTWLIMILYTLQVYYDFSGYSDMAIGLSKMFGFHFPENFNFPYISQSIKEFWRRWHISLSTWFKEYLYIPLGGSRKSNIRTYLNLLIVFFCTGLWHGASYNFIIWGLWHGFFLIIERIIFTNNNQQKFNVFRWIYTMLVVVIGWVPFRAENLNDSINILHNMFVPTKGFYNIMEIVDFKIIFVLILGLYFSGVHKFIGEPFTKLLRLKRLKAAITVVSLFILLWICILCIVANTYNPFIYFRF